MSKKESSVEIYHCPKCKRELISPDAVERHFRIFHGLEISKKDCEQIFAEKQVEISSATKKLPAFDFISRSPTQQTNWGVCDRCGEYSTRRWSYEKTTRGEVTFCATCRDQLRHNGKAEALDAWARLPGSYSG